MDMEPAQLAVPSVSSLERLARDTHEVDAVAVAGAVGQVVAEVGAIDADALAIWQHAHVLPVDLAVAEGGPAVRLRLLDKGGPRAVARAVEERLASVRVVKCQLARGLGLL